jgi:4-amino-4-deoxy-L-arabinose transferase-like glycosyltransferase
MRLNYRSFKSLAISLFLFGSLLRILLCWANPPENSFDDHYEPIFMIMESGKIPAKDACWQCYHPPVFYWISAMVGNIAVDAGAKDPLLAKVLQFIPCLYGILTVGIVFLILRKFPLSYFSSLIGFGTACFLPRHIYMSAMNSNDTISYLFVALSVYLLLIALERKLPPYLVLLIGIVVLITLFTKYTSYVVLPILLIVFVTLFFKRLIVSRKRVWLFFLLAFVIPTLVLSAYFISNTKKYGSPLPWNVSELDPSHTQPRDTQRMDFVSFKPWESISEPLIVPGKMHSFWTLVYNGMWFDNQPLFLYYPNPNPRWWGQYYAWLRGEAPFPGENPLMSKWTKLTGSGLEFLGLFPLLLLVYGFYNFLRGRWKQWTQAKEMDTVKMIIFPTLFVANAAGIIALALRLPVYSAAKASYFLNSMSAFAVFLSLGLMPCEQNKKFRYAIVVVFGLLFTLASLHILHIVLSLK